MPFCMTSHDSSAIQAVVIDNSVYVGGGYMHFVFREEINVVMVYSLLNRSWAKLPPYESQFFGMATVNDQLVVVGGRVSTSIGGGSTNVLGVWNKGWTHPLPVMPTARYSPSVISYQQWVVVAGGRDERSFHYSTVELLDTCSRRWYEGSPLPSGCSGMSAAIIGNVWYLSGGYSSQGENRHVFSVCLDELISQAVSQSTGAPSPWQTLPETPLVHSALLILNGALLAVGGFKSSAIHIYQPTSKSWVKVGYLPTQRWHCACTVLPNGEIFVAGGHDVSFLGNLILDSTDRVDIASIVQNNVK